MRDVSLDPQETDNSTTGLLSRSMLQSQLEKYKALCEATNNVFSCSNWNELGKIVLLEAMNLVNAEQGTYIVKIEQGLRIIEHVQRTSHQDGEHHSYEELTESRWGKECLKSGKIIRLTNKDEILQSATGTFLSSTIFVPIITEKVSGVIQLNNFREDSEFSERDESILYDFIRAVRVTLENMYLLDQLRTTHEASEKIVNKLRAVQQVTTTLYLTNQADSIFSKILDTIIEVMEYDYAAISLIYGDIIETKYGRSKNPDQISLEWMPRSRYSISDNDIVPFTAREGEPQIVEGWNEKLNYQIYTEYGHQNLIRAYVPIFSKDSTIPLGVIEAGFDKRLGGRVNRIDVNDLKLFAFHVGVAIENIKELEILRSESAYNARLDQWSRLGSITKSFFSDIRQTPTILQTVSDTARDLLRAHSIVILPTDNRGKFIREWITYSPKGEKHDYWAGDPKPYGIVYKVFQDELVQITDTSDLVRYPFLSKNRYVQQNNVSSFVGILMKISNDKLGVIFINFDEKREFTREELEIIEQIASLAAGAIKTAGIIESESARVRDLRHVLDTSKKINYLLEVDDISKTVLEEINQIIPTDSCTLWLVESTGYEEDSLLLKPKYSIGQYIDQVNKITLQLGEGIVGQVAKTKAPIFTQNAASYPGATHVPGTGEEEIQAIIAVPLLYKDELLGVISLSRIGLGEFDLERDLVLLEVISDLIAATIKIGFLLRELRVKEEQLEEEFDKAIEDRGERYAGLLFYNTVAHDVRNVLNIIAAQLAELNTNQRFLKGLSSSERSRLESGITRIKASQDTILEFLELARNPPTERTREDPNHLVRRAIRLMNPRLNMNYIEVDLKLTPKLPVVKVNSFRILEIILNLLSNSIKAMETKPENRRNLTITTNCIPNTNKVEILIADTGIGIRAEDKNKLFQLYHSWWPLREEPGTGIGLHVSKLIAKEHGGDLYLVDNRYGRGCTFALVLPIEGDN